MSIPNVSTLYERYHRGSEGGLEFARILNYLFIAERNSGRIEFMNFSDASGDFKGVDSIIKENGQIVGVQYKFFPVPFSSNHKSSIKESLEEALKGLPEMNKWRIITPDNPNKNTLKWFEELSLHYSIEIQHWGHENILELMLRHPHIGRMYYPEINYPKDLVMTKEKAFEYFKQFIDPNFDVASLFFQAQPSVADCKLVFSQKYYREISDIYYFDYRDSMVNNHENVNLQNKVTLKIESSSTEDIRNKKDLLPGGMRKIMEQYDVLQPNVEFYVVKFLEEGQDYGMNYSVWCYINGRWVFFHKPWRILEAIIGLKNDKEINRIIRWFKIFRVHKNLNANNKTRSFIAMNHIIHRLLNID